MVLMLTLHIQKELVHCFGQSHFMAFCTDNSLSTFLLEDFNQHSVAVSDQMVHQMWIKVLDCGKGGIIQSGSISVLLLLWLKLQFWQALISKVTVLSVCESHDVCISSLLVTKLSRSILLPQVLQGFVLFPFPFPISGNYRERFCSLSFHSFPPC